MARKREIHPNFFKNEDIAEMSYPARLLFIGIWGLADREGRLEDRPKKLRGEILPYDNCDGEELIAEIASKSFIVRYEVDGNKYIQINNWLKYQDIHPKETKSVIQPVPQKEPMPIINEPKNDLGLTLDEPKSYSEIIQESPVNPFPSFPSFPSLTPIVPTGDGAECESQESRIDYQGVLTEYNQTCPKMPNAISLNDNRRKAIRGRVKDYGRQAITEVFVYASKSPHHNGVNERGWTADFDWLLGPNNFVKMLERTRSGTPPSGNVVNLSKREQDDLERRRLTEAYDGRMREQSNGTMQSKLPSLCRGY